jgi:hypothetical protein
MNENVANYLKENKEKFAQEVLLNELRKVGYGEEDINDGVLAVYGASVSNSISIPHPIQTDFWDFNSKRTYSKTSEKWKDFLLGFFGPYVLGIFSMFIHFLGMLLGLGLYIFYIFVIVYLFNRRRFISYGIMANFLSGFLLAGVLIISLFGLRGF